MTLERARGRAEANAGDMRGAYESLKRPERRAMALDDLDAAMQVLIRVISVISVISVM